MYVFIYRGPHQCSNITINNTKLIMNKFQPEPLCVIGILVWPIGSGKTFQFSNNTKSFQSICLRLVISFVPWFIIQKNLHKYLNIQTFNQISKIFYTRFHSGILSHINPFNYKFIHRHTTRNKPPAH